MYELIPVTENSFYIESPAKIGEKRKNLLTMRIVSPIILQMSNGVHAVQKKPATG